MTTIKKTVQLFLYDGGTYQIILEPHEFMSKEYIPISDPVEIEFELKEPEKASKLAALDSKIEELKKSIADLEQKRTQI